jgi:acyl carrier protein
MPPQDIEDQLLRYLRQECDPQIDADSDLLESGLVDSLLVMELVSFIKDRFEVALGASDLAPRHFRSVARLTELVTSRRPAVAGALPG